MKPAEIFPTLRTSQLMALLPAALIGTSLHAAEPLDILSRQMDAESAGTSFVSAPYASPALRQFRLPYTYGTVGAGWNGEYLSRPVDMQQGAGEQYGFFSADAEVKSGTSTLWGTAGYTNGVIRDVTYNETSDIDLIYPYVTADEVGGDFNAERYSFSGGYADRHGRIAWGCSLSYIAGMYYRTVDPRPGNTTGKLDINAGIALNVLRDYYIGLAGAYRKYRQTCDLEFMSELGDATVYHFTGLGNSYARFTGTGYSNYYNGNRYAARLSLLPAGRSGLSLDAEVSRFTFDHILKDLNRLPLASAWHNELNIHAAWRTVAAAHSWGVKAEGTVYRRHGTENIFGDAVTGTYPQIGALEMYADNLKSASAAAFYQYTTPALSCELTPEWSYVHRSQIYASPAASEKEIAQSLTVNAAVAKLLAEKWYWRLAANYGATFASTSSPLRVLGIQLSASRKINAAHALGVKLGYTHADYHNGPIGNNGSATVQFIF
jgi:hypothetical protein